MIRVVLEEVEHSAACSLWLRGFWILTQLLAQPQPGKVRLGSSAVESIDVKWSEVCHLSRDV